MQDTSLKIVLTKTMELLNHTDLPKEDKAELMLNLMEFLDTKKYKENVKKLKMTTL